MTPLELPTDMTKQIILVASTCAFAFNLYPGSQLLYEPPPAVLQICRKNAVSGTDNAFEIACSVESDGEVLPFSILDNMPIDKLGRRGEFSHGDSSAVCGTHGLRGR